jgi:hypothetical protein
LPIHCRQEHSRKAGSRDNVLRRSSNTPAPRSNLQAGWQWQSERKAGRVVARSGIHDKEARYKGKRRFFLALSTGRIGNL